MRHQTIIGEPENNRQQGVIGEPEGMRRQTIIGEPVGGRQQVLEGEPEIIGQQKRKGEPDRYRQQIIEGEPERSLMPRIEEMYAFVAEDKGPDDEGIIGFMAETGWMPMVGADMARVESLKPIAQHVARATGKKIKLLRFTKREELGPISAEE